MVFREKLLRWYDKNGRDLPWRKTSDPYRIWLSEIILQQTRVDQGLPYFLRFAEAFPAVEDLARADEQKVLKLWQGLGYYSRARNLHSTAREIVSSFSGIFPESYEGLKQLKGIGEYTAAAIASISFGLPFPVVDGNVLRFFSRYFRIEDPVNSAAIRNKTRKIAGDLIDKDDPGRFNQAMMEFGALYCRPADPPCGKCIFMKECRAYRDGLANLLPVKSPKTIRKRRYFYYLLIQPGGKSSVCLRKREEKDIWKNLYDFPVIEAKSELSSDDLKKRIEWKNAFRGDETTLISISEPFTHHLTHQVVIARFVKVKTSSVPGPPVILVRIRDLEKFPFSRLIERYLVAYPLRRR
ncbi:MAG: A/G-specific adenine glycosylase [bacterium]